MPRPAPVTAFRSSMAEAESPVRLLNGGLVPGKEAGSEARQRSSLDFATRDPLGLRQHPLSDAPLSGLSDDAVDQLESLLASRLGLSQALTCASLSDVTRLALSAILGPGDDVLVDIGIDSAMFETILATRASPHRYPSASLDGVARRLHRLARMPRAGRVVIVAPAVSAHGARVTDLAELGHLARQHDALLVVDLSQDFGVMGQDGCGVMEIQSCLGLADLVLGCLDPAFGTIGGFAAWRDPVLGERLRRHQPAASLLPSERAAAALATAAVAFGPEGSHRRRKLHGLSLRLRNHLMADGLRISGSAAPFVPVLLPPQTALPRTALLESAGPRVSLLTAPRVPLHAPRWRIELSAGHSLADIDDLAELIRDVSRAFDRVPARGRGHAWGLTEAVT